MDARDFAAFFSATLTCLKRLEKEGRSSVPVVYRLVGLELGSAVVKIRPESKDDMNSTADAVADRFEQGFAALTEKRLSTTPFASLTQDSFLDLQKPIRRNNGAIEFIGTTKYRIDSASIVKERRSSTSALKPIGSVSGSIEALNIHNQMAFYVYPASGPRVKCVFSDDHLDRVRDAIGRHVTVHGTIDYDIAGMFPVVLAVREMDVHPDTEQLKLRDFLGAMPNLTDGVDSAALIRAQRDADD